MVNIDKILALIPFTQRRPGWGNYLFAVLITLAMLGLRSEIDIYFNQRPMLILFMFPIILAAATGGLGPGLLATLVSAICTAFFNGPTFEFCCSPPSINCNGAF